MAVAPFQNPQVRAVTGLSLADCESAAWALAAGGQRYRGAGAIAAAVAVVFGVPLPLWLYAVPGIHTAMDRAYAWIAVTRSRFPGDRPYCEQFPEHCR